MQLANTKKSSIKVRTKPSSVFSRDDQYVTRNIVDDRDKAKAHSLRHTIFCQELGWVPETRDHFEVDGYDQHAVPIGVFDEDQNLKAFLRIIMRPNVFMLEKEFPYLLEKDYKMRNDRDTVEISRLCVEPEARNDRISGNFGVHSVSMILYKGVYHWCLQNKIRFLYLVVEEKVYRLLCAKGFPCKLVGEPKIMPDGVIAVAAMLDWREFERTSYLKRPKMFSWFQLKLIKPCPSAIATA